MNGVEIHTFETTEPSCIYALIPGYKKKKKRRKKTRKEKEMNGVEIHTFETTEPSCIYALIPGYKKKKKEEKDKERKGNERRRNPYVCVCRYKITSTLVLLERGDPQDKGLRRLQTRVLESH